MTAPRKRGIVQYAFRYMPIPNATASTRAARSRDGSTERNTDRYTGRKIVRMRVCVSERDKECVYVYVRQREKKKGERERERERKRASVCLKVDYI